MKEIGNDYIHMIPMGSLVLGFDKSYKKGCCDAKGDCK